MVPSRPDVWVEINLAALKHNLNQVRGVLAGNVKIMAVVKANGYGHGYVEPSRALLEAGASALGVTRLEEGLTIREAGIRAPILLFAPIQEENADAAVEAGLDVTVATAALARAISVSAQKLQKTARVHIKIDSGMGRLGLLPDDVPAFFDAIRELPALEVAGIYTHFATSTSASLGAARRQLDAFFRVRQQLRESGIDYGLEHTANSGAILRMPESHLDMVRPGTLLYGQYPSPHVPQALDLRPTWRLKARICDIRDLPAGTSVGYGAEYTTRHSTRTAIIPIGYADGPSLVPEGPIYRQSAIRFAARKMRRGMTVDVRGQEAPVLGRIAMQMMVVDVTAIADVQVGDEAVIPAMRVPTSALVPRVYVDSST